MEENATPVPNTIHIPDDFVAQIAPREYPFYAFVVDNEVALFVEFTDAMPNREKIHAVHMSDPKIIPVWERIPEGYLYDTETGTFSAPE